MEESLSQESLSFVQRVLHEILDWSSNFVHVHSWGLLMVRFRVYGIGYEIVFDGNLEVQPHFTRVGRDLKETGEFYKIREGCAWTTSAPDDWIFIHLFPREADAVGSTSAGAGSDQCGEGS